MNQLIAMMSTTGDVSSTRFIMLSVVAIVLLKNVAFNVAALIAGGPMVPFDMQDIGMVASVLSGKVLQTNIESKGGK